MNDEPKVDLPVSGFMRHRDGLWRPVFFVKEDTAYLWVRDSDGGAVHRAFGLNGPSWHWDYEPLPEPLPETRESE